MGEALNSITQSSAIVTALMTAEEYITFWPQIEAQLDTIPHVWEKWYTKEYLRTVPLHQELMVWGSSENGALQVICYAHFIETLQGKGLQFTLAFGNSIEKHLPMMEATIEKLAQDYSCDFVEVRGRQGWLRKLKGFKAEYTCMSRQLNNFKVQ